jgi:hypothetical protein
MRRVVAELELEHEDDSDDLNDRLKLLRSGQQQRE